MSMKGMAKKKMGGFMCHSPAATAVCMTPDSRSVIIPGIRRSSAAERNIATTAISNNGSSDHHSDERLFNSAVKYTKLIDYHNRRNPRRPHHHHYQSQKKFISATNNSGTNKNSVILPNSMMNRDQALRTVLGGGTSTTTGDHQQIRPLDLQKPSSVLDSVPDHVFQVVVMRVSLHCQGCAGKLKKHLSKMEGVTSFSIELETKRVTVMGHVSPAGVLESISKFRRAEFWPSSFPADHHPQ